MYIESMDSLSSLMSIRRHYKKDSAYLNDLYTLTYDNHESLYMTNELLSSLHNTINSTDVAEDNVSFLNYYVLGQRVNSTEFSAASRYSPRVRLATVMREFTLLWLVALDSEMKKLLRFPFSQRGKSSVETVLSYPICLHDYDSRRMNMERTVFLNRFQI